MHGQLASLVHLSELFGRFASFKPGSQAHRDPPWLLGSLSISRENHTTAALCGQAFPSCNYILTSSRLSLRRPVLFITASPKCCTIHKLGQSFARRNSRFPRLQLRDVVESIQLDSLQEESIHCEHFARFGSSRSFHCAATSLYIYANNTISDIARTHVRRATNCHSLAQGCGRVDIRPAYVFPHEVALASMRF